MPMDEVTDGRPPLLDRSAALYLDFDGTLADIALRPDGVVVREPLPALLAAMSARLGGAVAVITGRRLADVDALLAPLCLPGAGLHGAELRPDAGHVIRMPAPAALGALADTLRERFGTDGRLIVEDKGAAVALHFRLAPEREAECVAAMRALAAAAGLDVIAGSRVVEARPRGVDKGGALRALASAAPFAARRPVFVGDDVTDEDGFRAAAALGGHGIKVGAGATAARYRILEVPEVHAWMRTSMTAMDRGAQT